MKKKVDPSSKCWKFVYNAFCEMLEEADSKGFDGSEVVFYALEISSDAMAMIDRDFAKLKKAHHDKHGR